MPDRPDRGDATLWIAAGAGVALLIVQTALAETGALTARPLATWIGTALAGALAWWPLRGRGRGTRQSAAEPTALALSGLAGLSLWGAAWWLMDLSDSALRELAGSLPLPAVLSRASDPLLGANLQAASYELGVLLAVVLIPLAQAWLLWGLALPAWIERLGQPRALWIGGLAGGAVMALSAPQDVEPALPAGMASVGGYLLLGMVAAHAAALSGSWWSGFAAHGTFAYASFALRDDLFDALGGRGYLDVGWLTVIVLGVFGAALALQVIRVRGGARSAGAGARSRAAWLPLALLLAGLIALAVVDAGRRQDADAPKTAAQAVETAR